MPSSYKGGRVLAIVTSIGLLMALFTTSSIAGHLDAGDPSGKPVQPVALHGNVNCSIPADGDFELRIQNIPATGVATTFPDPLNPPSGWDGFSVTITVRNTADGQVFDFTASGGSVETVYVKAGPHTNRYSYGAAGTTADTSLHGVVNPSNNQYYGLSHISFCYNLVATPGITTQVSSAAIALGGSVTDTATLSGGNSPTGTITFTVYGPNDATCSGTPVFTSANRPLSGTPPSATSAAFTPTAVGTYRWIASYSGDPNNAMVTTACNDPNETVVVSAAAPNIATEPWIYPNDDATITATSGGTPTGSVKFRLFNSFANCTAATPSDTVGTGGLLYKETVALPASGMVSTSNTSAKIESDTIAYWLVEFTSTNANQSNATSSCTEIIDVDLTP